MKKKAPRRTAACSLDKWLDSGAFDKVMRPSLPNMETYIGFRVCQAYLAGYAAGERARGGKGKK